MPIHRKHQAGKAITDGKTLFLSGTLATNSKEEKYMALDHNCDICGRPIGYEGICWKCRAEQERKEALGLTAAQIQEKQAYLIEHLQELERRDNPAETHFWDCLSYHGVISADLQRAAVKAKVLRPAELYYQAPEDVRDELIRLLRSAEDALTASWLMSCLAMQGDDAALDALCELKRHPMAWRKGLYADPDIYAQRGGWTFDESGRRLLINYPKCRSVEKKSTGDTAVIIGKTRTDHCPHCGGNLVDILSVDGSDKRLSFLGVSGKITATCCPNCVTYTASAYSRFTPDGSGKACFPYEGLSENESNFMSEEDYEQLAANGLELGDEERPLFYGANDWEAVTIGGFAHWIQDCAITKCPDCGKPMRYLAQLSWESIANDYLEGTLYVEICPDCGVASMHHQQT